MKTNTKKLSNHSRLKPRKKSNKSQVKVFEEISLEREHKCQVCGTKIIHLGPINFSHLLPKGSYLKYKYDKRNIIIKCAKCHDLWGKERAKNLENIDMWKWVCDLYYQLRSEANGCTSGNTNKNKE